MLIDHIAIEIDGFDDRIELMTAHLGFELRRIGHLTSDPARRVAMLADERGVKLELVEGAEPGPDRFLHLAFDTETPDAVDAAVESIVAVGGTVTAAPRRFEPAASRTATVAAGQGVYQFVAYDADSPDRSDADDAAAAPLGDEARLIEALEHLVGPSQITTDTDDRARASRDYAWMSPILREELPDRHADVVVRPAVADVADVLAVAHRHGVPVTPRGRGTGNYGQAVPLHGGIVVDLSGCDQIRSIDLDEEGTAIADVEAGVTFAALERAALAIGWEVSVMPSMTGSTIGGFISGGNQGVGSIAHGSIWDGWVREVDVAVCGVEPSTLTLRGPDVRRHLHTYGTTGLITGARIALAPAVSRTVVFGAFDDLADAAAVGRDLMDLDPPPRVVSIDDPEVAAVLPPHAGFRPGECLLRVAVSTKHFDAVIAAIRGRGGIVTGEDPQALTALYSSVYNHATLRAVRADPTVCALQVRGPAILEHLDEVRAVLPHSRLHLDGNAPAKHGKGYSGLLLSRWTDRATLAAAVRRLEELGVLVISPHTWMLGGHGGVDAIRAVAETVDPLGLLNPGKLPR